MRRATVLAVAVPILVLWVAFSFLADSDPSLAHPMFQAILPSLWFGVPLAIAAVIVVRRVVAVADGRDSPARILAVATAALPAHQMEWGKAMRAELESVADPKQRRRFAVGCAVGALRTSLDRRSIVIALGTAGIIAVGMLIASRVTLANSQGGVLGYSFLVPQVILALVGMFGSARRSFRAGLGTGLLALSFSLVAMLAVQVAEAGHWYDQAGVHIIDGDPPRRPLSTGEVLLDPITPHFVALYLLAWLPWPIVGAAIGARWLRKDKSVEVTPSMA